MRPLPPELLRSFVAIAQTGSFTAAAERVSLTQSTVSQHIRRLEDLLNCALFERDTRNVRLSRHGETLHRYAARILELMDEAVTAVSGPPLDGSVRLGLSEDFALSHLRLALASFVARNPARTPFRSAPRLPIVHPDDMKAGWRWPQRRLVLAF